MLGYTEVVSPFLAAQAGETAWEAGTSCRDYAIVLGGRPGPDAIIANAAAVLAMSCGQLLPFQRARFCKQAIDFSVDAMMAVFDPTKSKDKERARLYRICADRVRACVPFSLVAEVLSIETQP